jgi:hypothetical protein
MPEKPALALIATGGLVIRADVKVDQEESDGPYATDVTNHLKKTVVFKRVTAGHA